MYGDTREEKRVLDDLFPNSSLKKFLKLVYLILLLLLNCKFILRRFLLKVLKHIFDLYSKLVDFYIVVASV